MKHHITLATASLLFAIARPAMTENGPFPLPTLIEKAGVLMGMLGLILIALKWLSSATKTTILNKEDRRTALVLSRTVLIGRILMLGGVVVMIGGVAVMVVQLRTELLQSS
jgi:hypothetical protein